MSNKPAFHENLEDHTEVKPGSERSFGLVFTVVFLLIAFWPLFTTTDQEGSLRGWAFFVAMMFAITALMMPRYLTPFNKLWFKFGLLLHKIVNPLVMGLLFFLTVTPIALIMRALGKTPLELAFDRNAQTYWISRNPPGPAPETMKRQF